MAAFEPTSVRAIIRNSLPANERAKFETDWKKGVKTRLDTWNKSRQTQSRLPEQLEWEAHVVQYVTYINDRTRVHGNAKDDTKPRRLNAGIPLYGPRFLPPTYLHQQKREAVPSIEPVTAYLKPLNIVHPVYYDNLRQCPQCGATDPKDVTWNSWTTTGHRELHGVQHEECALGYQLRCKQCEQRYSKRGSNEDGQFCFATTTPIFWAKWEFWAIPDGIPIFFQRCGLTRELFDLVVEIHPSLTSGGLAEHIKQLHLLEYHRRTLSYLQQYRAREDCQYKPKQLKTLSKPRDTGYGDKPITDDLITDVLLEFSKRTRQCESMEYLRTLTGVCLSLDNTFKSAAKASIAERGQPRTKVMKGGILSVINEKNEIISWRLCQTQANTEIEEVLGGIKSRCDELNVDLPEMVVADNCCHVHGAIVQAIPGVSVVLDVYHMMMRYLAVILNGTKNPHRSAVAKDIRDAIIKTPASKGNIATYWSKNEQEQRLQAAYEKWSKKTGVWSAAASKVHVDQLTHVQKGCLARRRQDITTDGSRIEGSHKGWNSIMRSFTSGLEVFTMLGHDFVLRRNIRIAFDSKHNPTPFVMSTYGSHHIRLVNYVNILWNTLTTREKTGNTLQLRAVLPSVETHEMFGLVTSGFSVSFGGLIQMKEETDEEDADNLLDSMLKLDSADQDELDPLVVASNLNIDPVLLSMPQLQPPRQPLPSESTKTSADVNESSMGCSGPNLTQAPSPAQLHQLTGEPPILQPARPTPMTSSYQPAISSARRLGSANLHEPKNEDLQVSAQGATTGGSRDGSGEGIIDLTEDLEIRAEANTNPQATILKTLPLGKRKAETDTEVEMDVLKSKKARVSTHSHVDSSSVSTQLNVDSASSRPTLAPADASNIINYFTVKVKQSSQSSSSTKTSQRLATSGSLSDTSSSQQRAILTRLATLLPAPPITSGLTGLSRSQRLFCIHTGIDPRALEIKASADFFLFMEMRYSGQWVSFSMNSRKWAAATADYNTRLAMLKSPDGQRFVPKHPCALMEKLGEVESKIIDKLSTGDFKSRSGQEDFWRKHCQVVSLVKAENIKTEEGGKVRKAQTCSRCLTIKYPGGVKSSDNHKKIYCADGVKTKDLKDEVPDWPQPNGVFSNGTHFHPIVFLQTIKDLYERFVIQGANAADLGLDYEAFAKLLVRRTTTADDGVIYFQLFESLTLSPPIPEFIQTRPDGKQYLRVDCLSEVLASRSGVGHAGLSDNDAAGVL